MTQINLWKEQQITGAELAFESNSKSSNEATDEPKVTELYEQIARLKVHLEWLKKGSN